VFEKLSRVSHFGVMTEATKLLSQMIRALLLLIRAFSAG
jgi:hypothetical protein